MQIRPPRAVDPEGASLRYRALRAFVMEAIATWRRRSRTRRQLLALSERELRDVGLSAYERERESAKWFWQR
jgi:uncharacterized protein YjiS (DUF1127 family)